MKKAIWRAGLLGLVLSSPPLAFGGNYFGRDPQFNLPTGEIAYMGCYWSPLTILGTGQPAFSAQAPPPPGAGNNTTLYNGGNVKVGVNGSFFGQMAADAIIGDQPAPSPQEAIIQVDQAVMNKSASVGVSLSAVAYNSGYQNALLMHIFNPTRWGYNPGLTKYCGGRHYILVGVIDYDSAYPTAAKIREKENDQPVTYWGKRSILEQNDDMFAPKGANHVVALEFFLVSSADGKTVWQGNVLSSGGKMSGYQGLAEGLVESALKNLMRK